MPLILHDPRHKLPKRVNVLSGSVDVAPTVLHLLGVDVGLHSMTGHSIFGLRPSYPVLFGRVGGRLGYANDGLEPRERTREQLASSCSRDVPLLANGSQKLKACDLLRWMDWQDELWSARRLFPRTVYWGEARN